MPRSRPHSDSDSVSLFPFLAVLLCTMGALIVILVVIAQQARATAAAKAESEQAPPAASPEPADQVDPAEAEMLAWQVEQLAASREATATDLERARHELSGVEDHLRRLRDERDQLAQAAGSLADTGEQSQARRRQMAERLSTLQQQVDALENEVAAARTKAQTEQQAYSIVPYEGPNRTRRRPLYIECRHDSVVLQPEGIVLVESDFEPPLGPGNPLASALRGAVEYCQRQNPGETPYPLVLVRPEGIAAYYAVRKALSSWGSDFGYELIESDWNLEFPPSDSGLANVQRRAVEQGRKYQRQLAAAAPSRYGRRRPMYRASTTRGGFVQVPGSGGTGNGGGFGDGNFGDDSPGGDGSGRGAAGGDGLVRGRSGSGIGPGLDEADDRYGQPGGPGGRSGSQSQPGEQPPTGGGQFAAADGGGRPGQTGGGRSSGGQTNQNQSGGGGAAGGQFGGRPNAGAGQASGGSPNGAGQMGGQTAGQPGQQRHPADARGENWALKNAARRATPLTRPVRVVCLADRVVIMPETGDGPGRTVELPGTTAAALDDFASAMWEHMDAWGIAGNGFYWRPLLNLQVGPQGGQRAQELRHLLQGSGLDVKE